MSWTRRLFVGPESHGIEPMAFVLPARMVVVEEHGWLDRFAGLKTELAENTSQAEFRRAWLEGQWYLSENGEFDE